MKQALLRQEAQEFESAGFGNPRNPESQSFSAREVIQKLSEIKSGNCRDIDSRLLQFFVSKGLVEQLDTAESARLANLAAKESSLVSALKKQEGIYTSCVVRSEDIKDRLSSFWFGVKSFWNSDDKILLQTELVGLALKIEAASSVLRSAKAQVVESKQAGKTLGTYLNIAGEYCRATDVAADLLQKLEPREAIIGSKSIDQALECYLKERQVLSQVLDSFLETKMALEKGPLSKAVQRNFPVLASIIPDALNPEARVAKLTDLTREFKEHSGSALSEAEALRLACICYHKKDSAGTIVTDLVTISQAFGAKTGFLELFSAIKLADSRDQNTTEVSSSEIDKLKKFFKDIIPAKELSGLLAQLLIIPEQYHQEISALMQRLKSEYKKDKEFSARAAVALIGAGIPEKEAAERFGQAKQALKQSSDTYEDSIALAIACMPGCVKARAAQLTEINSMLSDGVFSKSLKQSVSLGLLCAAFKQEPQLFGMESLEQAEKFVRRSINNSSDYSGSLSSSNFSGSSGYSDSGSYSMMPFYIFDNSDSGSTNSHFGTESSSDAGSHGSFDTGGHSSDGGGSASSCSSGASSCSSGSSCGGGGGCGGGGCGGS